MKLYQSVNLFYRPLYLENKFEPLYHEYTSPKQTSGLIKKWANDLKLGLVPHVTQDNFHSLKLGVSYFIGNEYDNKIVIR